ncbi:FtsW/RodA/SpoVE family cell cycle protein [Pontixanthobacter gangjinensis]|uniref:Uncharacterized protein n=1 Tax=Pontixanthobacter gangjinensis TaxID=1028742 RepID=A0A6I4SL96_9SPHN|nr:hypothetical protein [Pontixanthobacter gangjinensis]MXO56671.1 hypothetical protein [Pontixanthobacter gangjinensis]
MRARLTERIPALLALAIPTIAGLAYLLAQGAPLQYVIVNGAALALAMLWIVIGFRPSTGRVAQAIIFTLLGLLYLPFVSDISMNGVARWLPAGPFILNSGAFAFPALAVLAASNREIAPVILFTSLVAAFLQPDAALGFAILFAAAGLHDVTKDWRLGVIAVVAFFASISMALRGELPPQDFAERVVADLVMTAPLLAAALVIAWITSMIMIAQAAPMERGERFALSGALFGFALMAILSHYPSILIGYGASPILGFGFALGLIQTNSEPACREQDRGTVP